MTFTKRQSLAVRDTVRRALLVPVATTKLVTELNAAFERVAVLGPHDKLIGEMVQTALRNYAEERANNIAMLVDEALDGVRREEEAGR